MLRQLLEVITIGLPFCAFKCITGLLFHQYWLVTLAAIDLFFNITNLFFLIFLKRRLLDTCLLSFLVHRIIKPDLEMKSRWQDLGNALDTLLSFILVAIIIGGNYIQKVPNEHIIFWNISVVLNVLGAGLSRITDSIKNLNPTKVTN